MIDEHDVREMLRRRANAVPTTVVDAPKAARRARRRLAMNGAVAVLAVVAIAVATFSSVDAIRTAPVPADEPTPTADLGIFAPVAGRIVFESDDKAVDVGYDRGLWAVDPSGPSDTMEGPRVADDVASTLVRLGLGGPARSAGRATAPSCCSSDGVNPRILSATYAGTITSTSSTWMDPRPN